MLAKSVDKTIKIGRCQIGFFVKYSEQVCTFCEKGAFFML